jgi:hypothetical protein
MAPITITIPHQLGRAEARRRIQSGFSNMLHQLPGSAGTGTEHWEGDRLTFSVSAMGQPISGSMDVLDAAVTLQVVLPGVLGLIAGGLRDRLQKAAQLLLEKK